ncbi:MAG: ATP-dependent sacrificial sulfur transferase LarE [Methanotrichaceae archaeon]
MVLEGIRLKSGVKLKSHVYFEEKVQSLEKLCDWFADLSRVLVALSGGVDSSVLAATAFRALGEKAVAVTVKSELQSEADLENARQIASEIGIEHLVMEFKALDIKEIKMNRSARCRLCKRTIAELLLQEANSRGIQVVVDGTNASDCTEDRPGMKTLQKLGIRMPLRELGITKTQVREAAQDMKLSNAGLPSRSCLATKIEGALTLESLNRVEESEKILPFGFRIEDQGNLAVVKVPEGAELSENVIQALKQIGYQNVVVGC